MKQQIITMKDMESLNKLKKLRTLRVTSIAYVMMKLFQSHIGEDNAISRNKLFKKLFNVTDTGGLADELRWEYTKRAMHFLRSKTKCFVVSKYDASKGQRIYFVVQNDSDANYYITTLDNNIKRMRTMQRRVHQSVIEKWWKVFPMEIVEGKRKLIK